LGRTAFFDPVGKIPDSNLAAHRISMPTDEQVELTATHAQAPGGLCAVAVGATEGLMEQEPFQLMQIRGQVFGLETGRAGGRWHGQLPQQLPAQQAIPQFPQVAWAGERAESLGKCPLDAFFARQQGQKGRHGLGMLVHARQAQGQAG
jgi:hypothetical protein